MYTKRRKRKINKKHVLIVACCPLILASTIFAGHLLLHSNPYEQYDIASKSGKQIGTMNHYVENNDAYYLSLFYPKCRDREFNNIVNDYRKKISTIKNNRKYIIHVDYTIKRIFDSLVQLTFHERLYNHDDKLLKKKDQIYTYDEKNKKMIVFDDLFRSNYMQMLKDAAVKQNIDISYITKENLHNFIFLDHGIQFHLPKTDKTLTIDFNTYKNYIKLKNKKIPALYQGNVIVPPKQEVDPHKAMVALTFDDGPHPVFSEEIMKMLEVNGARATFFMQGKNAAVYPEIVKDMYTRGFEVANHSWDHSYELAKSMDANGVLREINDTSNAIYAACGHDPAYFRPPYGAINETMRRASDLNFVLWSLDTRDWEHHNPKKTLENIANHVHDGSVILMHDIHKTSKDAVMDVAKYLKDHGYQMVTLSTLMKYRHDQLIKNNVVQIVPKNE